jgi:hypothetical protein
LLAIKRAGVSDIGPHVREFVLSGGVLLGQLVERLRWLDRAGRRLQLTAERTELRPQRPLAGQ